LHVARVEVEIIKEVPKSLTFLHDFFDTPFLSFAALFDLVISFSFCPGEEVFLVNREQVFF